MSYIQNIIINHWKKNIPVVFHLHDIEIHVKISRLFCAENILLNSIPSWGIFLSWESLTFLYTADTKLALIRSPRVTLQKKSWWKRNDCNKTVRKNPAASMYPFQFSSQVTSEGSFLENWIRYLEKIIQNFGKWNAVTRGPWATLLSWETSLRNK